MPEGENAGAQAAGESGGARRLRRWLDDVHRRTWELELLLSGAVVFALLRLPGNVDRLYARLDAGLGGTLEVAAFLGWYYVKLILYTLIGAFLVHLVARAYWVGLVGLDAVFPRGPRLERIDGGPLIKELYRRRLPSLKRQVTVADRFSSAVFSFAFAVTVIFVLSIVYGVALSAVALIVSRLAFGGEHFGEVFKVLLALLFAPMLLLPFVDRLFGDRLLRLGGRPLTLVRSLLHLSYRATGGPLISPIISTLVTNVPKRLFYSLFFVSFLAVAGLFVVRDVLIARGALTLSSHAFLPADAGALGVDGRYYDDRREPAAVSFLPSIPAEVVSGPYLRLFVPLPVEWTADAVAEHCPTVDVAVEPGLRLRRPKDPPPDASRLAPALACLRTLHELEIDGVAIEPELFFHTAPDSGVRGLVGHLAVTDLTPGGHLLTVRRRPLADDKRAPREHSIRFWR